MAYAVANDFRIGVDRRRQRVDGAPGSLWACSNGHITKGGDIEKRKKLVGKYILPLGHTFGMKGVGSSLYVFGSEDSTSFEVPIGVTYQRLQHPTAASTPMKAILDAIAFLGKVYVIVEFLDGSIHHYWDGVNVTDWNGGPNNPVAKGRFGIALGTKLYIAAGSVVYFCGINDPTEWTSSTNGAGFFNVSSSSRGSENLVTMSEFNNGIVFCATNFSQAWTIDADPAKNAMRNTIDNVGAVAVRGTVNYGNIDSYILTASGIRSVRQQTVSGTAYAADAGDNIDSLIQADIASVDASVIARSQSAVNPLDGRVWFWIGGRVYVLSPFAGSKILAWSYYDIGLMPGNLDVVGSRLYLRSGDNIYVYGGDSGVEYDTDDSDLYHCDVEMPFMDARRIAENKVATAYNVGATGEWEVYMRTNPNDETVKTAMGTVNGNTYPDPEYPMGIESSHFAPQFRSTKPGAATISTFSFDFQRVP